MSNSLRLLIDTNVWVDNYAPVRQESTHSRRLIAAAKESGAMLVYPIHSLKDVFYNLGATLKHAARTQEGALGEADAHAIQEIVWSCIDNMCELACAIGADESDAWKARKYRSICPDLEDCFVIVAAERANADIVVTRDEALLRKSTVPAYLPEDALGYLAAHA